jgi:hypothetical protein
MAEDSVSASSSSSAPPSQPSQMPSEAPARHKRVQWAQTTHEPGMLERFSTRELDEHGFDVSLPQYTPTPTPVTD